MFLKSKRGVSEVVAYVLLISISFALAGMVFTWLKFYVTPHEEIKCDEGVSLIIREYNYNCSTKNLTLTLQNRGLFNFEGYIIRVNNRSSSDIGVYTLNKTGKPLLTGETQVISINSSLVDSTPQGSIEGDLKFVEVQPFQNKQGNYSVYCIDSISKFSLSCS